MQHTDPDKSLGNECVSKILDVGVPFEINSACYDLTFHAGSCGIIDKHAISIPFEPPLWNAIVSSISGTAPSALQNDEFYSEDFIWLINREESEESIGDLVGKFLNEEKAPFQSFVNEETISLFEPGCNVNDWIAIWCNDNMIDYLAYSQG